MHLRSAEVQLHDKRLRNFLPQPLSSLPPPGVVIPDQPSLDISSAPPTPSEHHSDAGAAEQSQRVASGVAAGLRRGLKSARNAFGLFRRYSGLTFPSHDPDGDLGVSDLSDIVETVPYAQGSVTSTSYGPFPNKNSFLLGEWYWNRGAQKSQQNFKELLDIITSDDYRPADVRDTKWNEVNAQLVDGDCDTGEWTDEDAGWIVSPVSISVPFHRNTDSPGTREYTVANLHHRPLVSVIREKIRNPATHPHFHYEPYELFWQAKPDKDEIRVHGELYTSPAFIDAYNALQESPREPNCDLPRVVVGLMFWSDATHLTNFGNAKLWPLYLFFGNDSKYRRGKPSSNCCEHVAYFEHVCRHHSQLLLLL